MRLHRKPKHSDDVEILCVKTRVLAKCLDDTMDNAWMWAIYVEYRGDDKWAVTKPGGDCLSRHKNKSWHHEPRPSSRTEYWTTMHRFTWDEAVAAAIEASTTVKVMNKTAQEYADWYKEVREDKAS
ncbi:hypothetical protein PP304_gp157 [Gordonia phage Phendrix]|uniref:Uncharacterized protein n=2 Tax=Godonkavirus TaxID=2733178 RepID=A0A4D6E2G1_9CAUD|nr:hypothetical protein HOV33_gp160 [Gordonia phage GodonK]YP_010649210.1 hypothetical protein PP304_gp157 [Gordonia phage Phendrix]QBZ72796.1 hypothetical protein SEA_GODONK_208 [Gordonia phage GodonK]QDK02712.1 hypothetical protein SEA_PHENDRIX_196 [Gordonia phage Phendrix]